MKKKLTLTLLTTVFLSFFLVLSSNAASKGDIDGNGQIKPDDARTALRAAVGLDRLDAQQTYRADVDCDGTVTSSDARCILRVAVGLAKITDGKYCENTAPTQPAPVPSNSEFEYLRNGNYYLKGTMYDADGNSFPLEMAVTKNSVYMLSDFDGASIGLLINNNTPYMIYPEKKCYLELNSAVLNFIGISKDELVDSSKLSYTQYSLDKADSVTAENIKGTSCTVYIFNSSQGSTRFYLNGSKLLRFATFDALGNPDTVNDVSYITDSVPADKISPPSDYKKYKNVSGMLKFMSLLGL